MAIKKSDLYSSLRASCSSVLQSENGGAIYEVFPDGTRKLINTTTPPTVAAIGETRVLR
jgi:hypothetical protein